MSFLKVHVSLHLNIHIYTGPVYRLFFDVLAVVRQVAEGVPPRLHRRQIPQPAPERVDVA